MALKDLSEVAGSNTSIDSVNTGEGTSMSSLNNGIRAIAAILRQAVAGDTDTVASSPTCDIASPLSNFISISGQSQINGFSAGSPGLIKFLQFQSALNLVHSASVLLPGNATISTLTNDIGMLRYESSTITRMIAYSRSDGAALTGAGTGANTFTGIQTYQAQVRFAKGANVASSSILNLGTDGNYFNVTGAVSVLGIVARGVGTWVRARFNSTLNLIHSTDLVLPNGLNISARVGDEMQAIEYAAGDYVITDYLRNKNPAFSARLSNGTTITAGNFVKAEFGTEDYDNVGDYDAVTNYRFTPSVPGVYRVAATIGMAISDTKVIGVALYKNGSIHKQVTHASGATAANEASGAWDVSMNGTTDYLEIFAFNGDTGSQNLATAAEKSHFSAHRVSGALEI